jgi:anti-sigma-K factor RskA
VIGEDTEEQASLYVLGMLASDEARKFEAAMAADSELADLVGRLETGAAAFAFTAPPRDPPPALRRRIMDRIRPEAPLASRIAWLPWALAACLAVLLGVFAYKRYEHRLMIADFLVRDRAQQAELDRAQGSEVALQRRLADAQDQNADLLAQLNAARGEVADLRARNALANIKIAMLASTLKSAPRAMAVVAWDGSAQRGIVKTLYMPAAPADQDYQLWIIDPDYQQPVSAGVFDPGQGANFEPLHPISKAGKFAISLEKRGGSPTPQGPIVLVGG